MTFMDFILTQNVLSLFKNLQKAAINIVMPVCLSTWDNSATSGHIVVKFDL